MAEEEHAKDRTDTAANDGKGEEGGFGGAPFGAASFLLVAAKGDECDEVDGNDVDRDDPEGVYVDVVEEIRDYGHCLEPFYLYQKCYAPSMRRRYMDCSIRRGGWYTVDK